jgi:regulator of replication initiation timing
MEVLEYYVVYDGYTNDLISKHATKKAAEKQQHLQKLENDLVKLQEENVLLKAENKKLNERVDLLLNKL